MHDHDTTTTIATEIGPRKPGQVYADRWRNHMYRVVAILDANQVPSWFGGWGITVQHSFDGGKTFEPPVTHCTAFDPRYSEVTL